MEWVDVDEWHTGRVVLIGDAAHAGSPPMGQAGWMAMEDARASRQKCRARQRRWREC
jgi:2-polyprenyl-6-methoxyphenol hydroxylase-like FAD-dependent oxidoreductase